MFKTVAQWLWTWLSENLAWVIGHWVSWLQNFSRSVSIRSSLSTNRYSVWRGMKCWRFSAFFILETLWEKTPSRNRNWPYSNHRCNWARLTRTKEKSCLTWPERFMPTRSRSNTDVHAKIQLSGDYPVRDPASLWYYVASPNGKLANCLGKKKQFSVSSAHVRTDSPLFLSWSCLASICDLRFSAELQRSEQLRLPPALSQERNSSDLCKM